MKHTIWHTITLGTEKNLLKALEAKNVNVSSYAKDLLKQIKVSPKTTTVDLVRMTVGELGFEHGATTREIFGKAESLGLSLCYPEVAPQLLLQCKINEWTVIAHEPIKDSDGDPRLLGADRFDDGLWLDTCYVDADYQWNRAFGFAFVCKSGTLDSEPLPKTFDTLDLEIVSFRINGKIYKLEPNS